MLKKQAQKPDSFRISSALKDIIGRKLITDDFVAVFELVKNSFDAHAKRVDIEFVDIYGENPTLIIKDNGKGLDRADFVNKWLFVAYSAKKEGTEDYRDKIQSKRIHAGAKGIGRFSCDRLGQFLTIYSKKQEGIKSVHKLVVDWSDFEHDMKQEFEEINIDYSTTKNNVHNIKTGTVLEISGLRGSWDREKLLKLKSSLEKLINPNQENNAGGFSIYLHVPEEKKQDKSIPKDELWNIVNGKIKNQIFENLGLKTTLIRTKISADGKRIITRLEDRGHLIYEITERSPYQDSRSFLHDVSVHVFALNRSARSLFTRRMGVKVIDYGSIFLYKNGFRIHPIGDVKGGDFFGLDRRKQQHISSYLGTRDVIGRIEIDGENDGFEETTSRDGGIIKNQSYESLQDYIIEYAIKRLEKYATDVIKYSSERISELFKYKDIDRDKVFELINSLTSSDDIIDFKYDPKILDILNELSEKSLRSILTNFSRIAEKTNNTDLEKEAKKADRRLKQLLKEKDEAEEVALTAIREAEEAERKAEEEAKKALKAKEEAKASAELAEEKISQNIFLQSVASRDVTNILSLHHHIGIAAGTIENHVKNTTKRIKSGKPVSAESFLSTLEKISRQARKITSTTRFATKANFNLEATKIDGDICEYIREYLLNICSGLIKTHDDKKNIDFRWEDGDYISYSMRYRPLEVGIILDNLINNSRKAKSGLIQVAPAVLGDNLRLMYQDDGEGLSDKAKKHIFELGFTTTNGSGLGMYQVKTLLEDMNGSIELTDGIKKGAGFIITLTG